MEAATQQVRYRALTELFLRLIDGSFLWYQTSENKRNSKLKTICCLTMSLTLRLLHVHTYQLSRKFEELRQPPLVLQMLVGIIPDNGNREAKTVHPFLYVLVDELLE